jgi:hypothetical protein
MGNWLGKILARQSGGGSAGTGIADQGTIYYVSTAGSGVSTNIGSPGSFASTIASGSGVSAGDTIKMRGGTYTGQFLSELSGSLSTGVDNPSGKIIVKPYQDERPILDPGTSPLDVVTLRVGGQYVWFVGLESMISNYTNRPANRVAFDDALSTYQDAQNHPGIKFIGCCSHDNSVNNFSAWNEATNYEMHGCVSYYSGSCEDDGSNYGYSLYIQSSSTTKRVYKNAFVHSFGNYSIHGYSGNQVGMDYRYNTLCGPSGWQNMWLNYPGVPNDVQFKNNSIYTTGGPSIRLHDPGTTDAVITGNYITGRVQFTVSTPPGPVHTNLDFSSNTLWTSAGNNLDISEGTYPSNTYNQSTPGSNWVSVVPYDYIGKAGLVTVYNWLNNNTHSVDLSTILSNGDSYEVIDLQNRFGTPVQTGTYGGGSVSIDLTQTTIATPKQVPNGRSSPSHTTKTFQVFLVRATPYNW